MCKWHKFSMKQAATDPKGGTFDVGRYAVGLTAMALFRVEQAQYKLPELFAIDGFNPEELVTPEAQAAFARSGLAQPGAKKALARDVAKLRTALAGTARACDMSKEGLNITDRVTADGYKKTCCAPADPRENGPFLDAAVVYLFKGYDDAARSYASGPLTLISAEELEALKTDPTVPEKDRAFIPLLEPLRAAVEHFIGQPEVKATMESAFRSSIAHIFQTAPDDIAQNRGLKGPSNCIMCEGAKGRKPQP